MSDSNNETEQEATRLLTEGDWKPLFEGAKQSILVVSSENTKLPHYNVAIAMAEKIKRYADGSPKIELIEDKKDKDGKIITKGKTYLFVENRDLAITQKELGKDVEIPSYDDDRATNKRRPAHFRINREDKQDEEERFGGYGNHPRGGGRRSK